MQIDLDLILGVRRMYTHISQNIFEFCLFPAEMQMGSSANILFLLLEYNEDIYMNPCILRKFIFHGKYPYLNFLLKALSMERFI